MPEIRVTRTALLSLLQLERDRQTNSQVRQLFDECSRRATPRSIQQGKSLAKDDEISLCTIGIMSMTDTTKRSGGTEKQWEPKPCWDSMEQAPTFQHYEVRHDNNNKTMIIIVKDTIPWPLLRQSLLHLRMLTWSYPVRRLLKNRAVKTHGRVYEYSHTHY